ncbi:hypothetical protein PSPO01_15491 [Paraphaeosphaeria sporulosa]
MAMRTPTSSTSADGATITPISNSKSKLDLYFFDNNKDLNNKKKVIFAATYMRGMNHNNYNEEYLNLHADAINIIKDYPNFKKSLQ